MRGTTTLEEAANLCVAPTLGLPRPPTVIPAPAGDKALHTCRRPKAGTTTVAELFDVDEGRAMPKHLTT